MEIKEAIEWLKSIDKKYIHGGDEGFDSKRHEAMRMAISALERQEWKKVIEEAADVEEIVRCKNCVFWKEHDGFGKCINPTSNIKGDVWLNPLFYCRSGVEKMAVMPKEE